MSDSIEINFTPTLRDYAQATRWVTRRALGKLYWLHLVALASIAITAAFGFITLFDAAVSYPDNTPLPPRAAQGLDGALIFICAVYVALLLKFVLRRFIARRTYTEGGYFLAPRTFILNSEGVQNTSSRMSMHIKWHDVLAVAEDRHHLYLQLEPAFTLFIPKRIASSPDEIGRLHAYAEKMRSESVGKL